MAAIKLEKNSTLNASEVYTKVRGFLENDSTLKNLDPDYIVQFEDNQMLASAKGKKFKADFQVTEISDGSKVNVTVELPFAMMLFKGVVQTKLQEKLNQLLG